MELLYNGRIPEGCMNSIRPFNYYGIKTMNRFNRERQRPHRLAAVVEGLTLANSITRQLEQLLARGPLSIDHKQLNPEILTRAILGLPRDEAGNVTLTSMLGSPQESGIVITANTEVLPDVSFLEEIGSPYLNGAVRHNQEPRMVGLFPRHHFINPKVGVRNFMRPMPGVVIINSRNWLLDRTSLMHGSAKRFDNSFTNFTIAIYQAQLQLESEIPCVTPQQFKNILDWSTQSTDQKIYLTDS